MKFIYATFYKDCLQTNINFTYSILCLEVLFILFLEVFWVNI